MELDCPFTTRSFHVAVSMFHSKQIYYLISPLLIQCFIIFFLSFLYFWIHSNDTITHVLPHRSMGRAHQWILLLAMCLAQRGPCREPAPARLRNRLTKQKLSRTENNRKSSRLESWPAVSGSIIRCKAPPTSKHKNIIHARISLSLNSTVKQYIATPTLDPHLLCFCFFLKMKLL